MISAPLTSMINAILASEEMLGMHFQHEMNQAHVIGLMGYKRFFRYMSMDRERHSLKLQCFMVENYHAEPAITLTYQTPATSMPFIDSLKAMHDKSASHIAMLTAASKTAYDEGEHLLGGYLEKMICDQSKELDWLYRLWMDAKRTGTDLNYLSKELHKKMKCMEKKMFGYKSDKSYKY